MIGLFYPNRASGATISGGSWLAARPVTKVGGEYLTDVARSTSALTTSTKILMDLGASYALRGFAMAYTNLSNAATWAVKVGTTSGAGDVLTTSAINAWETGPETALSAIGTQDVSAYYLRRFHNVYVHTASVTGRYVTFEITDTGNTAGYVDVGRAFVGGGYVPTINDSYGRKDGMQDLSTTTRAESGSQWANPRRRLRSVSMVLEQRTANEAVILHDLQRYAGTVEDVLYVPDTTDASTSQRFGFLGNLQELSAMEYPFFDRRSLAISITEIA